ncbi:predicted protein [Naegleria gruberi]|uniref:Predicted protein n=1 Tax=Naegleria gruberi TaxID=5762 RepID=D2W312_NAEGR|nr:uncharacterized protein NAEGRDRAFT_54321 [Naegleria gruberi]EFC36531.1 predicted protein [Naegleria gruberi]|eukprot:XP_002669275.1 predicted protein [Naegleria gruberi strain NEG-M]
MEPKSYEYASERVRSDKEMALRILELHPSLYVHFHSSLLSHRDIQMKIIQFNPTHYYCLPKGFKYDKEFIVNALNYSDGRGMIIAENIPVELHSNEDVINAMIGAGIVQYLDKSKLTRDQILQCVKADGTTIGFFDDYMEDVEILKCALKQTPFALEFIPKKYQTLDIILELLEIYPDILKHIPTEFKKLDCVIETVIRSPNFKAHTISHLPDNYTYSSEEILLTLLLKSNANAIMKISPTQLLTLPKSNIISCLRLNGKIFPDLPPQLQQDPHLLKTAIKHGYRPPRK